MKKGFTLAELLGVIVILSLIVLLIVPLIINGVKNREGEVGETQENIIFEAANEFLNEDPNSYPSNPGDVYCISIKDLIAAGKLVAPVKDVVNGGNYEESQIIEVIVRDNGTKTFSFKDKTECKAQTNQDILITVTPSNNIWSKTKTATIIYPTGDDFQKGYDNGSYIKQYSIDNDASWPATPSNYSRKFPNDEDADNKDKFEAETRKIDARVVNNNTKKTIISKKGKVEKLDNVKPEILKIQEGYWNDNAEALVSLTLTDKHSGVAGYCILKEDEYKKLKASGVSKPEADNTCFKNYKLPSYGGIGTVSEYLSPGERGTTYYFFVKDKVGNVSDYSDGDSNEKGKTWWRVEDNVPPECTIISSGPKKIAGSEWYTGNVDVTITVTDDHSGVFKYDLTNSDSVSYGRSCGKETNDCGPKSKQAKKWDYTIRHNYDTTGTPYYGYVKDRAHNINKCRLATDVRRDTVAPTCALGQSGPMRNGWYIGNANVFISSMGDASPGSGVSSYGVGTSLGYGGISTTHGSDTTGTTYRGYIRDVAGNTNTCSNSITIKKDTVPPTCETSKSHLGTVDGVTVSIKCDDASPGSGVTTCPPTQGGVKSGATYTVRDGAGHENTCSVSVTPTEQNLVKNCTGYNSCKHADCGPATCTSGSCCGYKPKVCTSWTCEEAGTGNVHSGSSCGSSGDHSGSGICNSWSGGGPKTCTSLCCGNATCRTRACGCGSWNAGIWTTGDCGSAHSADCQVAGHRIIYS